jgi:DNA replication protein DnaC
MIGSHGLGKTHLAIGLGIEACQSGKHVKFFTAGELVHQLVEAKDEKRVLRLQQQLAKVDLLLIDELGMADCSAEEAKLLFQVLGMADCSAEEAKLLFQVLNARYEKKSTIITTNLEFKDWTSVFCTKQLTTAVLDRLIHRCHIIPLEGESYRFKESVRRKKKRTAA